MAVNRCPNPNCEYFNKPLPINAKICPMCGTQLGTVNLLDPTLPPVVAPQPVYPPPTTPPAGQFSTNQPPAVAPQPVYPPPITPPTGQFPTNQPPAVAPQPIYPPPITPPTGSYSTNPPINQPPAYYIPAVPPPSPARPVLKLIHSSGQEFYLQKEQGYIGRRGQNPPTVPEIDLTGIPHLDVVSRSHAKVEWDYSQNAYMIIGQGRNGTYLNGNLLTPGVTYRLNHGDLLQLGQDSLVCLSVSVT